MTPLKSRMALILALAMAAQPAAIRADEPIRARAVGANENAGVTRLTALVKESDSVKAELSARFASYFRAEASGGPLYIQVGDKLGEREAVEAAAKQIPEWLKDEKNAGKAATLYLVMGPGGALPGWARAEASLSQLSHKETREVWERDLARRMLLFSVKEADARAQNPEQAGVKCSKYSGPFKGADPDKWMLAFLECAAEYAQAIVNDSRLKEEIARRVKENEEKLNPPGVPDADGRRRRQAPAFSSAYDTDGLYRHGGVSYPVTDGKPGEYITVKMFSEKAGDTIQSRPAFFHVIPTAQGPKISWLALNVGENTLDGYKITVKDDGTVTVASTGKGGGSFTTDRKTLQEKRAELVNSAAASEETIEGKRYKVIGQGGHPGSYLYFPLNGDGSAALEPSHRGDVAEMRQDANTKLWYRANLDSPQALGYFGAGKDRKHYNLVWNQEQQYWEAKPGDPPKPSAPAPPPADQTRQVTDQPRQPGTTTQPPAAGGAPESVGSTEPDATTKIESCDNPRAFDAAGASREIELGGKKWRYWTADGSYYMCLYGSAYLFVPGYIASIEESDKDLRLTSVDLEEQVAGLDKVPLSSIRDGKTRFNNRDMKVKTVTVYHIAKKAIFSRRGNATPGYAYKVSWLEEKRLPLDPGKKSQLEVYTDAEGEARVNAAFAMLRDSADSGLFGGASNAGNREKAVKFLKAQIAKDTGALGDNRPRAVIDLHLSDTTRANGGAVVVYWNRSQAREGQNWVVPPSGQPYLEEK